MVAMVVVGSGSTDPQKFTKDYCGLFTDSGVMPKRHLARFPVTSNSVGSPCELNSSTPVLSGDSTWYPPYCFPFHNWSMGRRIWQDSGKRWNRKGKKINQTALWIFFWNNTFAWFLYWTNMFLKGFHGGMKRWGFHGMPDMHGVTKSHRRIGCIGSGRAKVWAINGSL